MFSVLDLGVVVIPVCLTALLLFFDVGAHPALFAPSFFFSFSLFVVVHSPSCIPLQRSGCTPTTQGLVCDQHRISRVGGERDATEEVGEEGVV